VGQGRGHVGGLQLGGASTGNHLVSSVGLAHEAKNAADTGRAEEGETKLHGWGLLFAGGAAAAGEDWDSTFEAPEG